MMDEEVRTYPANQETTASGITVSIPWVQRQMNGAVIARVHVTSPKHLAGDLLLTEQDLTALDADERPLRTQVRRFWGYTTLKDVTPAHEHTARFDIGFRADVGATRGRCALSVSIVRTFRLGEGPRAVGGPWVLKFQIADDTEVATALRAEATRQETVQREAAAREAARQERLRLESARQEQARLERLGPMRPSEVPEPTRFQPRAEPPLQPAGPLPGVSQPARLETREEPARSEIREGPTADVARAQTNVPEMPRSETREAPAASIRPAQVYVPEPARVPLRDEAGVIAPAEPSAPAPEEARAETPQAIRPRGRARFIKVDRFQRAELTERALETRPPIEGGPYDRRPLGPPDRPAEAPREITTDAILGPVKAAQEVADAGQTALTGGGESAASELRAESVEDATLLPRRRGPRPGMRRTRQGPGDESSVVPPPPSASDAPQES